MQDKTLPGAADLAGPHPLPPKEKVPREPDRTDDLGPGRDDRDTSEIEQDQARDR